MASALEQMAEQEISADDSKAVLHRLAELPAIEYDQCREREAKALNIRASTLDVEVKKLRSDSGTESGSNVIFDEVAPWPEPVNGADVLNAASEVFARYLILPKHADTVLTLWAAHAHCFDAFVHTPRLNITAPEKNCGKTLVLDVLQTLVPRALRTENLSTPVLFRLIDKEQPCLLVDEYDSFLKDNEELRGCLNAGHKRGGYHLRCVGDDHEVRRFKTFAPVALAGIRALPGTLHDRSLVITMTRAKPGEVKNAFDSRKTEHEQTLNRKLARWCGDIYTRLLDCEPVLPDGVFNRRADNWRPLAAIAEQAGGGWPDRLKAAIQAKQSDETDDAATTMLLADIQEYFATHNRDRVPSHDLVTWLIDLEERPWPEWRHGKPITATSVSRLLKGFGIKPKTIRVGNSTPKGYEAASFTDAFARYLVDRSATPQQSSNGAGSGGFQSATPDELVADGKRRKASDGAGCCGVADENPLTDEGEL